ncbi:hypothetical protein Tco_0838136 [Tanacetum coccineum]|uniref:Retrovirus-related Pol polyprotein from transposon TNT 1-94-like beta-barrel domain-containing protein n=1 Tax=Tanacetum coccineum TaxID=301880 RepID=A0ABQ5ARL0_9ASTR
MGMTSPKVVCFNCTKKGTLVREVQGHPGIKPSRNKEPIRRDCAVTKLLQCLSVWSSVMVLAMIGVTKQKKVQPILLSWLILQQVQILLQTLSKANNSNFNKRVNIVNDKNVNAARPNAVVNTARPKAVLSAVKGNKGNDVKASACWGNPQQDLKDKRVIDSGCSRHMTGNRSYLTDYEEIDGGFVAFGGNSK